jgi:hypothetical protein
VATIEGAPLVEPGKIALTERDGKSAVTLTATAVTPYINGHEPLGLVVVVEGHEIWMGNETYVEAGDPDQFSGAYAQVGKALDQLGKAGPPGSVGELIAYGNDVKVKLPRGPLTALGAAALGPQKDFAGVTARSLAAAADQAVADVVAMGTPRKVVLVIGDGGDTNPETARPLLTALRKKARDAGVELYGVYYVSGTIDGDLDLMRALLGGEVRTAVAAEALPAEVAAVIAKLQGRYYATFACYDTARGVGFQWDGKAHTFVVSIDKEDGPEVEAVLPVWKAPSSFPWLYVAIGGGAAIVVLAGVMLALRRRPAPATR